MNTLTFLIIPIYNQFYMCWRVLLSVIIFFGFSGCSIFIGNLEPVVQNSHDYSVTDLSSSDNWQKLQEDRSSEGLDLAYQEPETKAIVAANSACRKDSPKGVDLSILAKDLTAEVYDAKTVKEKTIKIRDVSALDFLIQGKIDKNSMLVRTIVFQRGTCVFDLMYISKKRHYQRHAKVFDDFVQSFRFK